MTDALEMSNDASEIYLGNLPFNYSEDDVKKFFAGYNVQGVRRRRNNDYIYAFVKFSSTEEAMEAIDEYKHISLDGKKLVMRLAHPNPQRDQSKPASTGQMQHGVLPAKTISGYESDDSDGPPPLVPIPRHIMLMIIREQEAARLAQNAQVEPAPLPTPEVKEIKDGFVESSARCEGTAEAVIRESPQGTTEKSNATGGDESYMSDPWSDDSDGPPPLVPIPRHIMLMKIREQEAARLAEKESAEQIQGTGNGNGEIAGSASSFPIVSEIKENAKEIPDEKLISSASVQSGVKRQSERLAKVIICDFPPGTTEVELMELFEIYCPVKCEVIVNSPKDSVEGFTYAFVFLVNGRAAALAASKLNGTVFNGNTISVKHLVLPDALL